MLISVTNTAHPKRVFLDWSPDGSIVGTQLALPRSPYGE